MALEETYEQIWLMYAMPSTGRNISLCSTTVV